MSNSREKNAETVRYVVANADLDDLDRFMNQYARVAVCEWLVASMPTDARAVFLNSLLATYGPELAGSQTGGKPG